MLLAPLPRLLPPLLPLLPLWLSNATWASSRLNDDDLRGIPRSHDDDMDIIKGRLLAPILIPRVPGTKGSNRVKKHFVDFFRHELPEWELIWHNSTSKTPASGHELVHFDNLIFRRDPPGTSAGMVSRLTLVAHFDSKLVPKGFIGATDSAAPCAILLQVARSIEGALKAKWTAEGIDTKANAPHVSKGVQIIFLDGEEAFVNWSDNDSLYGSRSLAAEWERHTLPPLSTFKSPLDSINLLVLLDLLGSKNPTVPSYFLTTHWAYRKMAKIERRMRKLGFLKTQPSQPFLFDTKKQVEAFSRISYIQDDHIPFMHRNVDILHIIPSPFPAVWHKPEDDGKHLDMATVRDWAKIVTGFAAEWLDLTGYMANIAMPRDGKASEWHEAMASRTKP